jgi:toxin ParE1/3/4
VTRVVISPRAEQEIEDIWLIIAADDPTAANRVVRHVGEKIDRLAIHPRLGPRRPDISPAARILIEGPYLIIYEHQPNADAGPVEIVDIVSVIDGRRDLTRLL